MLKYHHDVNSPHDASGHGLGVVQARDAQSYRRFVTLFGVSAAVIVSLPPTAVVTQAWGNMGNMGNIVRADSPALKLLLFFPREASCKFTRSPKM